MVQKQAVGSNLVNNPNNTFTDLPRRLDYARPGTIPVEGETLATGGFMRWLKKQVDMLCFEVRRQLFTLGV